MRCDGLPHGACPRPRNPEGRDDKGVYPFAGPEAYVKAKAETTWRFWGLYVHVCKMETLSEAYALAKSNNGAPGIDGVTFAAIEAQGVATFLAQIQDELVQRTYVPLPARRQEIPKDGGKVRVLSIPAIRDRVVQGAMALFGCTPKRPLDYSGSAGLLWAINGGRLRELHRNWAIIDVPVNRSQRIL
jgi:hypothetical protein